tara:strand:- start:922 stop:1290 length:369 start_codon:yes stop_codon:yes gene_type:complete
MAAQILKEDKSPEQKLFQAVVLQAFEDALTTHGSKQESYLKKDAHDWFLDKNNQFDSICWYAGFDPEIINEKYKKLLIEGKIKFTRLQEDWVAYRNLYKNYRAAKTSVERRNIMIKICRLKK